MTIDPTFSITTTQVQEAIKSSKTNKSTGPGNINIQHLKHLGPLALDYLTKTHNLAIHKNNIPPIWKLSKIIPIPKPNKNPNEGTSFRPIALLSPIAKLLRKQYFHKSLKTSKRIPTTMTSKQITPPTQHCTTLQITYLKVS